MTKVLHYLTDRVTTKKGMWLTLFSLGHRGNRIGIFCTKFKGLRGYDD